MREALATYQRSEDLINLGAYASGANPELDSAIQLRPHLLEFLRQTPEERSSMEETLTRLLLGSPTEKELRRSNA